MLFRSNKPTTGSVAKKVDANIVTQPTPKQDVDYIETHQINQTERDFGINKSVRTYNDGSQSVRYVVVEYVDGEARRVAPMNQMVVDADKDHAGYKTFPEALYEFNKRVKTDTEEIVVAFKRVNEPKQLVSTAPERKVFLYSEDAFRILNILENFVNEKALQQGHLSLGDLQGVLKDALIGAEGEHRFKERMRR